jgi:tRNA(Arg) A34 adenosine deaminase TadA
MDFLRLIILMALVVLAVLLTERSKRSIYAHQAMKAKYDLLTHEDTLYLKHVEDIASVQPASIVVHNGMVQGTGHDRIADVYDQSSHAETEAIRDACKLMKEPVLKGGILYASRQPCDMCMRVITQAGISKVCIVNSGDQVARTIFIQALLD